MSKIQIKIDVVSDVVCPWCYIGKRRLEKALQSLPPNYEVSVSFQPFELNPQTPTEGYDQKAYLAEKFGGEERYHQLTGHTTKVARDEGLDFNYAIQEKTPNTFEAHRLIWFAKSHGVQPQVKEALMSAYFEKGVDLTDTDLLLDVVASAGLDRNAAATFLKSNEGVSEVKQIEALNRQRGITGVPFYIINNKYGLSGAQPSETFLEVLTEVGRESATKVEGEVCAADGSDC